MATPTVFRSPFQIVPEFTGEPQSAEQLNPLPDGSFYGIWREGSEFVAQRFDADGNALTSTTNVGDLPINDPVASVVTPDNNIHFVYQESNSTETDISNYDKSLHPLASYNLNLSPNESADHFALGSFQDNGLLVAYRMYNQFDAYEGVSGQIVSANGTVGTPFQLFDSTHLNGANVASLSDDNMVAVARGNLGDGTHSDIDYEILGENGAIIKAQTTIQGSTSATISGQTDVAALRSGGFVVTYDTDTTVDAAVLDANGNVVRNSIVAGGAIGTPQNGEVTALDDGGFLVSYSAAGSERVQRFDANGNRVGNELVVPTVAATGTTSLSDTVTLANGLVAQSFTNVNNATASSNIYNDILETRTDLATHVTGANFSGTGTGDFLAVRATSNPGSQAGGTETLLAIGTDGSARTIGAFGTDWAVDGAGDTNGDGRSDIFLYHDVGNVRNLYIAQTTATGISQVAQIGAVGTNFAVDGVGDFNQDGFKDQLLDTIDANGNRDLYTVPIKNGVAQGVVKAGVLPSTWQVDAVGNLTKNPNESDILMHYDDANGTRHLELLRTANNVVTSVTQIGAVGDNYQIDGLGDFDGDGDQDILMHYDTDTSRNLVMAKVENGAIQSVSSFGPIGKNTEIDGIGDFNGDGTADVGVHTDNNGTRTQAYIEVHNFGAGTVHLVGATGQDWIMG